MLGRSCREDVVRQDLCLKPPFVVWQELTPLDAKADAAAADAPGDVHNVESNAAANRPPSEAGGCWCGSASGMTAGYGLRPRPAIEVKPTTSGLEAVVREAVAPGTGISTSPNRSSPPSRGGSPSAGRAGALTAAPDSLEWDAIYAAVNVPGNKADGATDHAASSARPRNRQTRQII